MIEALAIGVGLLLIASAYWLRVGFRAIIRICADIEHGKAADRG